MAFVKINLNVKKCQTKQEEAGITCDTQKVYVCVFGDHASRGIHLEYMLDKSSDSFIQAIQRMSNRRSMPLVIHSDNAKGFVSGKIEFKNCTNT